MIRGAECPGIWMPGEREDPELAPAMRETNKGEVARAVKGDGL